MAASSSKGTTVRHALSSVCNGTVQKVRYAQVTTAVALVLEFYKFVLFDLLKRALDFCPEP